MFRRMRVDRLKHWKLLLPAKQPRARCSFPPLTLRSIVCFSTFQALAAFAYSRYTSLTWSVNVCSLVWCLRMHMHASGACI